MKHGWKQLPFEEVIEDCSSGNPKVLQSSYQPSGKIPVVDQGKELIAGYVDDASLRCKEKSPRIIFGDHTRIFKFIDFPFCLGADGVKVLRPKIEADTKFLFHCLRALQIPEAGYSRHYKFLKRMPVVLPPLAEQRRIAEILDQAEALRAKRRQALAKLDTLTPSLFLEMFGDSDSNPKGWTKKKLVDICSTITDGEHQTPKRSNSGFKLLSARNVRNGHLDFSDVDYVDEVEFERIVSRCRPQRNDVLISCSGTIGRVSAIRTDEGLCLVRSAALLRPIKENVDTDFLEGWLLQPWMTRMMMSRANASGQPNLFQNQIKELPILVPPLSLQHQFSVRAGAIREQRIKFETAFDEGDKLASSLQHRAFRGEL
ncbi:restriction endonuclease subunit S [Granulicella cerasi]|uniref:Restriction endonuclease subunit S n=1 Tax=Granulicella cerasi TaxID=741063 RepID=A0ABW1Z7D8_9BACT|nr:restriction endonuclease subunit S [Granulicella cerasi]